MESANAELENSLRQQRELERQVVAREKTELIETLVGGIAHEINNKLTPIVGFSELLRVGDEQFEDYCRMINEAALDASRIIRQLLQLSRPTATEHVVCDLRQTVEQSLTLLQLRLKEANIDLEVGMPADPTLVSVDPLHGGTISVESAVGHATTFSIALPLTGVRAAERADPRALEIPGRYEGLRVLVVEDDDAVAALLMRVSMAAEAENPDNIVVTPRGGLLLCENNSGATLNDAERLLGLTLDGKVFTFAKNNVVLGASPNGVVAPGDYRQNEWAGACYSPDGRWLFANVQTPGVTFAITGPWGRGPL